MKGKMKWVILGIIVIIIAVAVVLTVNEMQFAYEIEEIKEINYVTLEQDNKYGVIDKTGKIVVEPTYNGIQIPNPSKPVFICIGEYDKEAKEYDTKAFNDKGEQLFSEYDKIETISVETNIETTPYEKSTLIYRKDGKYGLITLEGKQITEPIYEEINSINYKEGTFAVKFEGKFGAINLKGKEIIKPEYETITSDNYYNEKTKNKTTGFIVSKKTENGYRYGYINYRGKVILKTEYTELERITEIANEKDLYFIAFREGQAGLLKKTKVILNYEYEDIQYSSLNDVFVIQRNGKQGVVSKKGETIVNAEYDTITFGGMYIAARKGNNTYLFDLVGASIESKEIVSKTATTNPNYFITVDQNDIYNVIDSEGKIVIDNNYSYIEYLSGDYFIVAKDGKNGVIDITGKSVVDLAYTSIFRLNDTEIIQAEKIESKTIDLYSSNMHKIASQENASIITGKDYILLASDKEFAYYDFSGNKLDAKDVFPNNQLFAKKINDKWGFVDKSGNVVIQNEYEMVTDFNEYGFAGIKQDGKWGVIEQNEKKIIQEPVYELEWTQPSFIGKYYQIRNWHGGARYSADVSEEDV